ncbi:MAG: c-type cytochrome [Gemmatimonadetes bacterium]|nr:c-type cytochrome [Gemmatimonadota bacterium]
MSTKRKIVALALVMLGGARAGQAQVPPARETVRSVLEGVYTEAQAERGKAAFGRECSACHATGEFTGAAFRLGWTGQSVRDRVENLRATMPLDAPGRLAAKECVDILAYVLKLNGYPSGEKELASDSERLSEIRIDPKPDTRKP